MKGQFPTFDAAHTMPMVSRRMQPKKKDEDSSRVKRVFSPQSQQRGFAETIKILQRRGSGNWRRRFEAAPAPVPVREALYIDQIVSNAIFDAMDKSLPRKKRPKSYDNLARNKKVFSRMNIKKLADFTGLNLNDYLPVADRKSAYLAENFSYNDIKLMLRKAVYDRDQADLAFVHNYQEHRILNQRVIRQIEGLSEKFTNEERLAAKRLLGNSLPCTKKYLTRKDLDRIVLRSGLPANSFFYPRLDLRPVNGKPATRFFTRKEALQILLEATLISERPAPYFYYHSHAREKVERGFSRLLNHDYRRDYYQNDERRACHRGRYVWTAKILELCKIVGVEVKDLSWEKFMKMVHVVNEIANRNLKNGARVTSSIRHTLSSDELYEFCRRMDISPRTLLQQEAVEQMQTQINVGGCAPPLV